MIFGKLATSDALGAILAHSLVLPSGKLAKGKVLAQADLAILEANNVREVIAAKLEPGDMSEDEAASELAEAIALNGMTATRAATGRVNFHAAVNGLFYADRAAVDVLNSINPAITLATLANRAPVRKGDLVATIKIIPLAVPSVAVSAARRALSWSHSFNVRPFKAMQVGLVATTLPSLKTSVMEKTRKLTEQRLALSGSRITEELRCAHTAEDTAKQIRALAQSCEMIIIFGASAMTDPNDVIPAAIRLAGGEVKIAGMPVDPGNLLVFGMVGDIPVIGAPGCARSPKENGFDWILNRILAGEIPEQADAASLGVGGLLMEIPLRPSPREIVGDPPHRPSIGIAVLAAGKASRMGGPHKLLAEFDGEPLVRRSVAAAVSSGADAVCVVTGYRADDIEAALSGLEAEIVRNPDFETGMSSSIRAGLAELDHMDGLCIALADMPGVTAQDLQSLNERFRLENGNAIIRAVSSGKRGNPVILPKVLFPAISRLEGDIGARHIIEQSGLPVIDVEIGEAAHLDADTPEAIRAAGGIVKE